MPMHYAPVEIPGFKKRVASLIHEADSEYHAARRRLRQQCQELGIESVEESWIVENFAETNNYYHTELMTYLEMLLEAQRVKNLSVTELLHRWQQIRDGMCEFSAADRKAWFQQDLLERMLDWALHDSRLTHIPSQRSLISVRIEGILEAGEGVYYVHYWGPVRKQRGQVYVLTYGQDSKLFSVHDCFGRLTDESGFIFLQ